MTIGELAERTGVSRKTIRDLEGRGLIYTAGRSQANYRLFDWSGAWPRSSPRWNSSSAESKPSAPRMPPPWRASPALRSARQTRVGGPIWPPDATRPLNRLSS